jgi:membrane protein implicated in regulation of membrane protease activity
VILKYALIHTAELVALVLALIVFRSLVGIPTWMVVAVLTLWVIKDIALFPRVWKAYAFADNRPVKELLDLEATVAYNLDPVGYVRARGELWRAEVKDPRRPANRGDCVRVVDIRGMTLIVERCEKGPARRLPGSSSL